MVYFPGKDFFVPKENWQKKVCSNVTPLYILIGREANIINFVHFRFFSLPRIGKVLLNKSFVAKNLKPSFRMILIRDCKIGLLLPRQKPAHLLF